MSNKKIKTAELFDLEHTIARDYLSQYEYPWQALAGIKNLIIELGKTLDKSIYTEIKENVWVANSATVFESAYIGAPTIIGENAEVTHCAYIRGGAIIGNGCVVGNSCEVKNSIFFDNAKAPHFNYVGDSILGYKAHMGAGSITSNLKSDGKSIVVHADENIETGLRKIGAMIGDNVEVGCNSVLNPGTVIGRNSMIYPTSCVRGVVPANSIYKNNQKIEQRKD